MKKFLSVWLLISTIVIGAPLCPAQQTKPSDWNALADYLNREIAVKTKNGETKFGVLKSADAGEIKIQIVERKNQSGAETKFSRNEIVKVWSAQLRYGKRKTAKGALIGAGVGAAAGLIYVGTAAKGNSQTGPDGQAGVAVPVLPLGGAAIGSLLGAFSRKNHKKIKLIYAA